MILVVGATGQLGGLIVHKLLSRGHRVRALVRDRAGAADLAAQGADIAVGDLTHPDSLLRACDGVRAVVTTANSMSRGGDDTIESVDRAGNTNLIQAATLQGVDRFVFVSALGADPHHPMPLLRAKGETESRLRDSDLAWTILQPDFYMELLMMIAVGAPALAGETVTLIGEGRRRHSLVSMADVAAYAVAVLEREDAAGQTLVIGGPEPVSLRDVIVAFETDLGREVTVRTLPIPLPSEGATDPIVSLLASLETYDSPIDMTAIAERYGVAPTRMSDFVSGVVASTR
ncbi:SDR family oxidoreductase [Mycetocola sp. 2940]|uniref:SDR family oxidoreductase n=1 Tax=Mycetocola sp. 2940 TaxID=3156452 RepID=UPI00339AC892